MTKPTTPDDLQVPGLLEPHRSGAASIADLQPGDVAKF
jgi:hypothetical protein